MFFLSSVNTSVLFQEQESIAAENQAKKRQQKKNRVKKGNHEAELDDHVSAGCFACYLLHYLRAISAHFLRRPVTPEQATQRAIEPSRTASSAARPNC